MLQNNAFVEPGAEVETIKGNLLRVVNRPKVVKNCVKMYYGTVLEEQTRDCAGNWKKKSSPKPFHWAVRHKTNTVSQAAS